MLLSVELQQKIQIHFLPCPGKVTQWMVLVEENVRSRFTCLQIILYHLIMIQMIGKLIVWGRDKNKAINIMKRALAEF